MRFATILILAMVVIVIDAQAQSLPELARQERARQGRTLSSRIFTNETLPARRTPVRPLAQPVETTPDTGAAEPSGPEPEDIGPTAGGRTEAEWRKVFSEARDEITRSDELVELVEAQLSELNRQLLNQSDIYNREYTLGPQILAKEEELEAARQRAEGARGALPDLQEELRRAGGPAGWGRS